MVENVESVVEMWNMAKNALARSYIADALEDKKVKKILPRYVKVVKDELPANFQIAKRIVFDFNRSMSAKKMWEEHDRLVQKLHQTQFMIDKNKLNLNELEVPRFSLLDLKIMLAKEILKNCELCERKCHINRLEGEKGFCKSSVELEISSMGRHWGEERFLIPSFTVFWGNFCNFRCVFCQNYDISQLPHSTSKLTPEILAKMLDEERRRGVRNWNWVGSEPTPSLLSILQTLKYCETSCPSIWNSNMYMSEKAMKLLDGVIDVYLADFKYGYNDTAKLYSKVDNYWEVVTRNHLIAAEQAELIIRILVMPGKWLETDYPRIVKWIAQNLRKKAIINVMSQYRPEFLAPQYMGISRRLTKEEMKIAIKQAKKLKLNFIT